jgi:hypothetical protein
MAVGNELDQDEQRDDSEGDSRCAPAFRHARILRDGR